MRPNSKKYVAGLYLRLSKDDDNGGESSSISTQRKMLTAFAKDNSYLVYDEYVDDGWSGTTFDRPGFKRMIQDIEDKKINLVITKDLSRLGRDYIMTGKYTEIYFPSKSVRYIAINDGYDSNSPYTDIAPFKNVLNEMYARDISKKIRSSFLTKMHEGNYIGNFAPYGYKKDPNNKNHLILDDESAAVVKKIFDMGEKGHAPIEIARYLNNIGILTPSQYRCKNNPNLNIDNYSKRKEWTSATICKILRNAVYLGNTVQGKTTKVSFKSKITVSNDKDNWIVVKNTHEPIVSKETFDIIKSHSMRRSCPSSGKFYNIFSGIAKCMDCGKNMSTVGTRKKGARANLACGAYKLYGSKECSNHFIDYDHLYEVVLKAIREKAQVTDEEIKEMYEELKNKKSEQKPDIRFLNLESLQKKLISIDSIIEKLYEDNFNGDITSERFKKLLNKYESQYQEVKNKIDELSDELKSNSSSTSILIKSYEAFSKEINKFINIKELNTEILNKLIDRIEIGQGKYIKEGSNKVKKQEIKIYFRFIGANESSVYNI